MFTGIIEEVGEVRRVLSGSTAGEIAIRAKTVLEGTKLGDSIAVNGVCLTVTGLLGDGFTADVMPETLRRTNLGRLGTGSRVNLERAMAAQAMHVFEKSAEIDLLIADIKRLREENNPFKRVINLLRNGADEIMKD